ncbi:MAG: nickel pincer cofactor biosynthesis protein LarC [Pseudomonadales bacterium]
MSGTLYYDCFSGISGDMHIGAMLDLGVPETLLREQLWQLPIHSEFELRVERDKRKGISGTRASVLIDEQAAKPHRHLRHIVDIIQNAGYPAEVEALALDIFQRLGEAEAGVHDISVESVHFHEVGATDAIVDVVAAALCIGYLAPERVYCGPVEVGSGTVRCEHGLLPVPAPATAALLQNVPCHYGRVKGEATTPTGAAILKAVVTDFTLPETLNVEAIGYGVGQKDFEVANVLRVSQGHSSSQSAADSKHYLQEANIELVCNIDDMSPEASAPLLVALWNAGALDVDVVPVSMKKQRTGLKLTVLMQPQMREQILAAVFQHSSSIGVRTHEVQKTMLPRTEHQVSTSLGQVRVKVVTLKGGQARYKVEHDDVMAHCNNGASYLATREQLTLEVGQWFRDRFKPTLSDL